MLGTDFVFHLITNLPELVQILRTQNWYVNYSRRLIVTKIRPKVMNTALYFERFNSFFCAKNFSVSVIKLPSEGIYVLFNYLNVSVISQN